MTKRIITISRQFGSGGRQIGDMLSKQLNIPFYDKALCVEAAKHSGIHPDFFENAEMRKDHFGANAFFDGVTAMPASLDDRMFLAQAHMIHKLAELGPCIIVGRGANRLLERREDVLNVFIYAKKSSRLKRIIDLYGVAEDQAEKLLIETDKNRAAYLKNYTDQTFGKAENYHLCIDSSTVGIDNAVKIILAAYRTLS